MVSAWSRIPLTSASSGKYRDASLEGGLWVAAAGNGEGFMTGARVRW